jgi:hypothetical protein
VVVSSNGKLEMINNRNMVILFNMPCTQQHVFFRFPLLSREQLLETIFYYGAPDIYEQYPTPCPGCGGPRVIYAKQYEPWYRFPGEEPLPNPQIPPSKNPKRTAEDAALPPSDREHKRRRNHQ